MDRWTFSHTGSQSTGIIRRREGLPWIPWRWIRNRYSPEGVGELPALFKAYTHINSIMDIEEIRSGIPPRRAEDACHRCGQCCAQLLPEPVDDMVINRWMNAGNPVHTFHAPVSEGPMAGRFYTGWYHEGVRLRMCPLLLRDPATGEKFCVVYHLGPGHRPPGCEGFRPNWPHCEVSQRPLVP